MSIENTLERIATALEIIAGNANKPVAPSIEPEKPKASKVESVKTEAVKPVEKPKTAKIKEDAPASGPEIEPPAKVTAAPAITLDQVLTAVRQFADKVGADKAKAVMVKYGADKAAPKSKDIKPENYPALMAEIG